ncbi:MAG: hypothetical protein WBV80_25060 [Mycobacterium sp.]
MTEVSEPAAGPTTLTANSRDDYGFGAHGRLFQAAAWVVIVAGVVFVAAILFFSGLRLGSSSDFHNGWRLGNGGSRDGTCPMMESGQMMGPGQMMSPRQSSPTPQTAPQPNG